MSHEQSRDEAAASIKELHEDLEDKIMRLVTAVSLIANSHDPPLPLGELPPKRTPQEELDKLIDAVLTDLKNVVTTDPVTEPASRGNGNWQGT